MLTLPSENGAPGRVATYAEPSLCMVRLDDDAGAADRTATGGVTNAVEDATRVAAAPRNIWVATMLLSVVGVEKAGSVGWCGVERE